MKSEDSKTPIIPRAFRFLRSSVGLLHWEMPVPQLRRSGVANGDRTRNNQNHNLELYH